MPAEEFSKGKKPHVLVADDNRQNVELLTVLMEAEGYHVRAAFSGLEALEQVARELPDLILLDVMLPGLNGYAVCQTLKVDPATKLIPVILITVLGEEAYKLQGIDVGADDFLTKPVSQAELKTRIRSLLRLKFFTDELERAEAMLKSLALTIAARDLYTAGHCERLARYSAGWGRRLGLPEQEIIVLGKGAFLHDLGKVGVPDTVLLKPGPLTLKERTIIEQHPLIGVDLLRPLKTLQGVATIIRHHHERYDGSGYPDGLSGDAIPLGAQIIATVDGYDALTTTRPYRMALSHQEAIRILRQEGERGWRSRELVESFITMVEGGTRGGLSDV